MKNSAINPQEPLSGETILSSDETKETLAEQIINFSRKNYAILHQQKEISTKATVISTENTNNSKSGLPA